MGFLDMIGFGNRNHSAAEEQGLTEDEKDEWDKKEEEANDLEEDTRTPNPGSDPALYQAIELRATNVARSTLLVYEVVNADSDDEEEILSHMVTSELADVDWALIERDMLRFGEAFLRYRGRYMPPVRVHPDRMGKDISDSGYSVVGFRIDAEQIPFNEIIHFWRTDAVEPISPINTAKLEIRLARMSKLANIGSMLNGVSSGLIILVSKAIGTESIKTFLKDLRKRFGGPARRNTPMLIDDVGDRSKVMQTDKSNADMEFGRAILQGVKGISQATGVPPMMIGDLSDSTYSNFREAVRFFQDYTIFPELRFFSDTLNEQLFGRDGQYDGVTYRCRFDLGVFEPEEDRRNRLRNDYKLGIIKLDYVQREMGYPVEAMDVEVSNEGTDD